MDSYRSSVPGPREGLRERIQSEVTAIYIGDQRFVVVPDRFLLTLEELIDSLTQERDSWERVAREYEAALADRSLL